MAIPYKVMIIDDRKKEPKHPCDPEKPCDPCDDTTCSDPKLCREKLKNPMEGWESRCKTGNFISVEVCDPPEFEHPCDPIPPCDPGKPKLQRCPVPPLRLTRIKNPVSKVLRCPSPDDLYSPILCANIELLKTPIPVLKDAHGCPKVITLNPFDIEDELQAEADAIRLAEEEAARRRKRPYPDYMYQNTLCKNLDMLKKAVKSCFKSPCQSVMVFNPFDLEEDAKQALEESEPPTDPCRFKP